LNLNFNLLRRNLILEEINSDFVGEGLSLSLESLLVGVGEGGGYFSPS
jgi:hypothetical protein